MYGNGHTMLCTFSYLAINARMSCSGGLAHCAFNKKPPIERSVLKALWRQLPRDMSLCI